MRPLSGIGQAGRCLQKLLTKFEGRYKASTPRLWGSCYMYKVHVYHRKFGSQNSLELIDVGGRALASAGKFGIREGFVFGQNTSAGEHCLTEKAHSVRCLDTAGDGWGDNFAIITRPDGFQATVCRNFLGGYARADVLDSTLANYTRLSTTSNAKDACAVFGKRVTSEQDCSIAAKELLDKFNSTENFNSTINRADRPLGCYVNPGDAVYFNAHPLGSEFKGKFPICKSIVSPEVLKEKEDQRVVLKRQIEATLAIYARLSTSSNANEACAAADLGQRVTSVEDCSDAAKEFSAKFDGSTSRDDRPSRCYINVGDAVYFNVHPTGGESDGKFQICKSIASREVLRSKDRQLALLKNEIKEQMDEIDKLKTELAKKAATADTCPSQ